MKILNLTQNSRVYTSNVYFVSGTWNAIKDMNTLIDVGRDASIIETINYTHTGLGQAKVNQVFLTHSHYDHASLLPDIKKNFRPDVYAWSKFLDGVDHCLENGQIFRIADDYFEIIYTPGHSNDSICLYCETEKILFSGDTPLVIHTTGGSYEEGYVLALENLAQRDIQTIYPGHGQPSQTDCNTLIRRTLDIVLKSF
jgi:glyoxylase-like metal-dependent hydrolase (beta-lactamase superfamily II)